MRWTALVIVVLAGPLGAAPPSLEDLHAKARVDGKYRMLLRQLRVPDDAKEHGDFREVGYQARSEYAGHKNLPAGHWVYAAPYWYIWRDRTGTPQPRRPWGPEQLIGPPDTWPRSGDVQTAWASLSEDGQDEWLLLEYPEPVQPQAVIVYATFNPGAVARVSVFRLDGDEVEVWKGQDPTPIGSGKGVSVIPFRVNFKTNRVRIELRSKDVSGWNEIDAVGLRAGGKTHWVAAAEASSTYATVSMPVPDVDPEDPRLDALEKEVRELRDRIKRLEEKIRKRKMQKEGGRP
jgi:hypothetical protein